MKNEVYIEKDKTLCPYLLAASFTGLLTFTGSNLKEGVLYWHFSPMQKAEELIESYYTKHNPYISARDIFEATETFWKQIARARNGEMHYGKS